MTTATRYGLSVFAAVVFLAGCGRKSSVSNEGGKTNVVAASSENNRKSVLAIPDGSYSMTITMVEDSCGGGVPIGTKSDGQLDIVTDARGQSRMSFSTAILAVPNLIAFPTPGIQQTLIAVSADEFKWGWSRIQLRMTNEGNNTYSVVLSMLSLSKMGSGFQVCVNEYKGEATAKSGSKR